MNRTSIYQERAAYCAFLLHRVVDPQRRALIERERQDWLALAAQPGARPAAPSAAEPRAFAPPRRMLDPLAE